MEQFTASYIKTLSTQFYIFQVLVITALVLYGLFFVLVVRGKRLSLFDLILAYPISLAMYGISGYFLLSVGITFNKWTEIGTMLFIMAAVCVLFRKNVLNLFSDSNSIEDKSDALNENLIKLPCANTKVIFGYLAVMVILALIATSGVIPVSLTNDSMYFFSEYPRALIYFGKLVASLDNFVTDASQGVAIIGTIPFFFGFDEIFGIQTLLNLNFIVFYIYAIYEYSRKKLENKLSLVVSALAVLILLCSMPYVIMARWYMANMFFMEYMAIFIYASYKYVEEQNSSNLLILSILITGLSIMRMEGALNAGVLILCAMMLSYSNKDIVAYMLCPVLVLQSLYLFKIFWILDLHTGFQFMTKQKAGILIAFLLCIILYVLIIRDRFFKKILKHYPLILCGGMVAVNILIFILDRSIYISNLKAFAGNVLRNSGWGLLASVVIGIFILIPKKSIKLNYFDYSVICYILLTIVAGWARGDGLYESFGDSGNRILIQVVPALLMVVCFKIVEGLNYWQKEDLK